MGYRSELKVLIYPQNGEDNLLKYEQLKTIMNTTFKKLLDYWEDPYFTWDDHHRILMFSADHIKWYESYPEVAEFEQFVEMIDELGYEYEFMRIGENDDDIETRSSRDANWYLSLRRSIEVDL